MAYKALIFGTKKSMRMHKSYSQQAIAVSNIEIIGQGFFEGDNIRYVYVDGRRGVDDVADFDFAIILPRVC